MQKLRGEKAPIYHPAVWTDKEITTITAHIIMSKLNLDLCPRDVWLTPFIEGGILITTRCPGIEQLDSDYKVELWRIRNVEFSLICRAPLFEIFRDFLQEFNGSKRGSVGGLLR